MSNATQNLNEIFAPFIGNMEAVEALKIEIEGARRRGVTLRHMLLTGYPGTGKTMLANLVSQGMDATFIDINCGSISAKNLEDILFQGGEKGRVRTALTGGKFDMVASPTIVFWDEAHALDKNLQIELLKPMLDKVFEMRDGTKVDVRLVTHVFATTDGDMLLTPLKDRCEAQIHLERYNIAELAQIIASFKIEDQTPEHGRRWFTIRLHPVINQMIAERSKHTPRLALNLIKGYYNFLRSQTDGPEGAVQASNGDQINRFFRIQGVGIKGLRRRDWHYLQLLAESDKPMGASLISSQLEISDNEVKNEIEPHLRFCKLIETGKSGRSITRAGRLLLEEHLTPTRP
jgi:holliday junction DNA helicase RuvB